LPSLFVIQGRDQGTRFRLDGTASIGRGTSNSVQLHDTEVSRDHAELVLQNERYLIRDLGSSNGTFVNGRQVRECELASGDQLQVGRTLLLYTGVAEERVEDLKRRGANFCSRRPTKRPRLGSRGPAAICRSCIAQRSR
jgi:pSer/pThr/pTyr-binding forkhead associated (FHA) protein